MIRDACAREGGDESASPSPLPVPSLDPELAERLRRSADTRIAEQIQAAKQRTEQQRAVRDSFTRNRDAGLRDRHAAKQARLRLIANHQQSEETP